MKKLVGTVAALMIGGLVVSGFMLTTEPTASARVGGCASKGTKCGEHSYDANNDMCCSKHCSWSNPDQKYECE